MKRLCGRHVKDRYATEDAASQALLDAQDSRGKPKGRNIVKVEKRTYLCSKCDGWHLTSQAAR